MDIANILIVDDQNSLDEVYSDLFGEKYVNYQGVSSIPEALQMLDGVHLVLCDPTKFNDVIKLASEIKDRGILCIWASKFGGLDFDKLPIKTRVMNKPFRPQDVKFAVRSEIRKANLPYDISVI